MAALRRNRRARALRSRIRRRDCCAHPCSRDAHGDRATRGRRRTASVTRRTRTATAGSAGGRTRGRGQPRGRWRLGSLVVQGPVLGRGPRGRMWRQPPCQGARSFTCPFPDYVHTLSASYTQIIQLSPAGRPVTLLVLDPSPTGSPSPGSAGTPPATSPATYAATTVAWAPSCGRSYHLVATGARDGRVRIWKLRPPPPAEDGAPDVDGEEDQWAATIVADFDHHK